MLFTSHPLIAPLGRLAARRRLVPSVDAVSSGWWIESGGHVLPESALTLRRLVSTTSCALAP